MYQHGKRTRQPRNMAVFMATVAIIGVVVLVAWYMVHKDIGNATSPKTNVPIITEVGVDSEEKLQVNETLFTLELPADWKLNERRNDNNVNFYQWVSTKKGGDDRRLTLHVDIMPQSYKLVKMLPLTPNNTSFLLGNVSDDCRNFANVGESTAPVEARWENVRFMCDPIKANQTIGTGTPGGSIGTKLGNGHTFYFYYEDFNIYPDNEILRSALQSFRSR